MTINEIIKTRREAGSFTFEEISGLAYGIKHFCPDAAGMEDEDCFWWARNQSAFESRLDEKQPTPVQVKQEMVKCSCGHTVPRFQVMSASMGTSCPRCYDRMSG